MIPYSLYVVDDEALIRDASALTLGKKYHVNTFSTAEAAIDAMQRQSPDLVLLDIGLPGMSGLEALKKMKTLYPEVLIIMITAYDEVETVISAMKMGAYDYVVKPINMDGLEVGIANALETIRLRKEVRSLQQRYLRDNLPFFIGESKAMVEIMEMVKTVAESPDAPVLIRGETGTGKELVASRIHYQSPRFRGPFVALNCAAIAETIVESELFGYEKGAFSGAAPGGKKGLIESASGGTLFLDEIGDLSPAIQAKLLRFLESGEYYKVGGTQIHRIQTRVVSATHYNLEEMVDKGLFRQDLYYRLAVVKIEVPNLNQRPEDILPMAKHFLLEFSRKLNKPMTGISCDARHVLQTLEWKGNVRELRNRIERGVLLGKGSDVTLKDLGLEKDHRIFLKPRKHSSNDPEPSSGFSPLSEEGLDLPALHEAIDRHYLDQAINIAGGNYTRAARLLKMSYYAFRRRKEKLDILN